MQQNGHRFLLGSELAAHDDRQATVCAVLDKFVDRQDLFAHAHDRQRATKPVLRERPRGIALDQVRTILCDLLAQRHRLRGHSFLSRRDIQCAEHLPAVLDGKTLRGRGLDFCQNRTRWTVMLHRDKLTYRAVRDRALRQLCSDLSQHFLQGIA